VAFEELEECLPSDFDVEAVIRTADFDAAINSFVRGLPTDERRIFIRRYWHLEPLAVVAAKFGYTQSKVKSMLFRTRNRLRDYLVKEGLFYES
jgi:RNA polymerase sigma-70 factor (ECF subfamily)